MHEYSVLLSWFMFYNYIIIIIDIYFDKILSDSIQVPVKIFKITDYGSKITIQIFGAYAQRLVLINNAIGSISYF